MSDAPILGSDGQPHPEAKDLPEQTLTPSQFCAGVISAYIDQMSQNGIDPINSLLEMGMQVPSALIQFVKFHTKGLTQPAEEPLRIMLKEIAGISEKFGFTMTFQLSYTGEEQGEQDERREPDTGNT